MWVHPKFDPVAAQLGPLSIHWYGLMYLLGFLSFIILGKIRLKQLPALGWTTRELDDLLFYGALGVIVGGRLGYVVLYQWAYYSVHWSEILKLWEGGMSFHGGLVGVCLMMGWFAYRKKMHWLTVTDFIAPTVPVGLAAGRLGNFINGELWGRVANPNLPWAIQFSQVDWQPRHPSQLYEFLLEGCALFVLLWLYARKDRPRGTVSALFLVGYSTARIICEFFREPDAFLGTMAAHLTMGQWLSLPMLLLGIGMWWTIRRSSAAEPNLRSCSKSSERVRDKAKKPEKTEFTRE